jgi:YfiR/HmsC-like
MEQIAHRRRLPSALENAAGFVLLLAGLLLSASYTLRAADEQPLEYQVKAAFLLNFTKFVEWPATAFADEHSPLAICILGEDPFGNTLTEMVKGEGVNGHEIVVQRIRRAPAPKACQVLFIGRAEREAARILSALGTGVLSVGEGEKFLQDGGIVAFVVEDRRVRFDIDQSAAAKAMLTISSRLMNVARSVQK